MPWYNVSMKRKLLWLSLATVISSTLVCQSIKASPAPPSPTCRIVAKVLDIHKVDRNTDDLGNTLSTAYVYYHVKLDITNIRTVTDEGGICDDEYANSAESALQEISLSDYNASPVSRDDIIQANIHFGGDEFSHGWYLSDIVKGEPQSIFNTVWFWIVIAVVAILALGIAVFYLLRNKKKPKK